MRWCSVCSKGFLRGEGNLFTVPKDENTRIKWSVICGKRFKSNSLVCSDHFAPTNVVRVGNRVSLLPNSEPLVRQLAEIEVSIDQISETSNANSAEQLSVMNMSCLGSDTSSFLGANTQTDVSFISVEQQNPVEVPRKYLTEKYSNITSKEATSLFNLNNSSMPPQLKEEPIIQMPVIKSVSCTGYTQTNTRFCGLVQVSDFADEFRFNCFYCSELFPLEEWQQFINHLKNNHFDAEAFTISKFVTKDHDYTPISIPASNSKEDALETVVINAKSLLPFLVDPLDPANNTFESVVLNSSNENRTITNDVNVLNNFIKTNNSSVSGNATELDGYFENSTNNMTKKILNKSIIKTHSKQTSNKTILSRCLNRTNVEGMEAEDKENDKSVSIEHFQQKPTEITFEYSPRDIVDLLLDSMRNYPVLWQFNDVPFNKDFYEAVEDLCKIINDNWSLSIDNLTMRRSINRIFRFFCYLYPNANIENIDQFTCYYDKCAVFLPSSVNEIAYARCSHCYLCYRNDFELKRHLLEEQKYLRWPYKCVQCKECFRENDEYEFHKRLSHYAEIFRCEPCNKKFVRRSKYNRHIDVYHPKDGNKCGKYVCDICGKAFRTRESLTNHKIIHEERKFKCNLCSKTFFTNAKLKLHVRRHRKEYDFICEVCGKGFIVQRGLEEHMKKHTGAKVTCNICNLRLRKSSLMRHLRLVHVAFAGSDELSHRKNHYYMRLIKSKPLRPVQRSGKRKYRCKTCKINFDNYKSIVEHNKQLHSDVPKWPCKMCSTEFNLKINLRSHYRKKHNLHVIQVYKLVDENEDLNVVLAMDAEELDKVTKSLILKKNDSDSETPLNNSTSIMRDDIFFEDELVHTSTIQDEIMKDADDIETQEIKIDYMNDFFTDLLKAEH